MREHGFDRLRTHVYESIYILIRWLINCTIIIISIYTHQFNVYNDHHLAEQGNKFGLN
jgi:hypothetical protein